MPDITIPLAVSVFVILLVIICCIVRAVYRSRNIGEYSKFTASDFNDIANLSLRSSATDVLNNLYMDAKTEMLYAARKSQFSIIVKVPRKLKCRFGDSFESLIINPFTARMNDEGFDVQYYPNGSLEYADCVKESILKIAFLNKEIEDTND